MQISSIPTLDDETVCVRAARDDDAADLIALIGGCFAEYPGVILDVDGEEPELREIATAFAERNGRFWVVESRSRIVGCVGAAPSQDPSGLQLRKLYVDRSARRRGLGARLCGLVEDFARELRKGYVELWSDTRFLDAHRLYEGRGYVRGSETRELHDRSNSIEFYFRRDVVQS